MSDKKPEKTEQTLLQKAIGVFGMGLAISLVLGLIGGVLAGFAYGFDVLMKVIKSNTGTILILLATYWAITGISIYRESKKTVEGPAKT